MSTATRALPRTAPLPWLALAIAGAFVVGLAALVVVARPPAVISAGDTPPSHTISVTGTGRVLVVPDRAVIRLGVLARGATAAAARDAAARSASAVTTAIRDLGIPDTAIRTSELSLQPVYTYPIDGGSPTITGYEMRNGLTVTVTDLERAGPVIDGALLAGANTVDGVTLEVSDRSAGEQQARQAAVADARRKADTLVNAAGTRITDVISISESVATPGWPGRGEAPATPDGTPITPGLSELVVTVTIAYGLP